jgi:hypothetical protein
VCDIVRKALRKYVRHLKEFLTEMRVILLGNCYGYVCDIVRKAIRKCV